MEKDRSCERRVLILGGKGQAMVVSDVIRAAGGEVIGMSELDASLVGVQVEPGGACVVISQDELFEDLPAALGRLGANEVVVGLGHNTTRLRLSRALGEHLAGAWVHPRAVVSPTATLGRGTVVLPGAIINAAATIGEAVILNTGCIVEHECVVEDGVHLSPNATLCGGVRCKPRAWVAAGSTVIPLKVIGEGAVVGAGSTVIGDVPDGVTVVGSPARPISGRAT